MKPFHRIRKPLDADFFSIYEDNDGVKNIHVNGYSFKSDSAEFISEDNPNGIYWGHVEVCWFIMPLAEFVKNLKENENFVDDTYEVLKQYQEDLTATEMVNIINNYYNGYPPTYEACYGELTEDSPCGYYIQVNREY